MTGEFIINVLLIVSIYLLAIEVGVIIFKAIKEYVSHQFDEFEEVGVIDFDDEEQE